MEVILYLAGMLALFRAAIQEGNVKKLTKENKDLRRRLGRNG